MMGKILPLPNFSTGMLSEKALLQVRGEEGKGCCFPHGHKDVTQLLPLPLSTNVCPLPFLNNRQILLVIGDLEHLCGARF